MAKPTIDELEQQILFEPPVDSRTAAAAIGIHHKTSSAWARFPGFHGSWVAAITWKGEATIENPLTQNAIGKHVLLTGSWQIE